MDHETSVEIVAASFTDTLVDCYSKCADALQMLKIGKADAAVLDSEPAAELVSKTEDLEILEEPFDTAEYADAVKKGNAALLEEINGALSELRSDGTFEQIYKNWFGEEKGMHFYRSPAEHTADKGTLVMAADAAFPPITQKMSSGFSGFGAELKQAVCDRLGYELTIEETASDSLRSALESEQADVCITALQTENTDALSFTDELISSKQVIVVRKK